MDANEALAKIRAMLAEDAEAATMDVMLYGRTILCITPDGPRRVPPEDFCIIPTETRKAPPDAP